MPNAVTRSASALGASERDDGPGADDGDAGGRIRDRSRSCLRALVSTACWRIESRSAPRRSAFGWPSGAQRAQVVTLILKGATRLVALRHRPWPAGRVDGVALDRIDALRPESARSGRDWRRDPAAPRRRAARRVPCPPGARHASIRCRPCGTNEWTGLKCLFAGLTNRVR